MAKRPAPFQVDQVRVRVHSGPRPDGRWRWRADRPDGHAGRVAVWSGWGTREEAGAAVMAAIGDQSKTAPANELVTVRDLLETWVASQGSRQDVADRTRASAVEAGHRLLAHNLGSVSLDTLERRELERHRDAALRAGVAGSTIQRDLKYLRQAWRWGQEIDEIAPRLLPRVRVERVRPVRTRYTPTTEEVIALLEGVTERVYRGLVLLAGSGCRIGEISGLRWRDVPLDARRIRVEGKTGERQVELPRQVAAEIRRWERGRPDARVVEISEQTIRQALARRASEIGIPRVSPNGLRRHVVDVLYRTGRIDAAAAHLGHSAQTALSIYRQVTSEDRRQAIDAADLGAVVSGPARPLSATLSKVRRSSASNQEEEYSQGEASKAKKGHGR